MEVARLGSFQLSRKACDKGMPADAHIAVADAAGTSGGGAVAAVYVVAYTMVASWNLMRDYGDVVRQRHNKG